MEGSHWSLHCAAIAVVEEEGLPDGEADAPTHMLMGLSQPGEAETEFSEHLPYVPGLKERKVPVTA